MSVNIEKEINKSIQPARFLVRTALLVLKEKLLEKIAPISPGGSTSVKRKILERILENK